MGNKPTKKSQAPANRYQIHGIQYLEESPKRCGEKAQVTQNGSVPNGRIASPAGGKERNALYVSNDWTENIRTVADVDWMDGSAYPYENIVMSGGGSKGYAFIGALKALEDAGILQNIRRVAGSSAGAICAGLIAVGCTPQEIADVFKGDIKWLFQDQTCAGCCCIPKIFKTYGVHPGQRFYRIYGQHIAKKTGNPDTTFAELREKYGRELCIVVTNLSKMCSEYCTAQNTPDLPVRTAVRMSMSFPMVYEAVKCEINGQTSLYTDGGTLDQYPVHCFDDKRLDLNHNTKIPSLKGEINKKTIGIYVVSESAIDYKIWSALFGCKIPYKPTYLPDTKLARMRLHEEFEKRKRKMKEFSMKDFMTELRAEERNHEEPMFHYETCNTSMVDIRNFKDYFVTTIETLLISQRKLRIRPQDAQRTVAVNCGYIGTNDYVIEAGDREFMLRQGYEHTEQFLKEFIKKSNGEIRLDASLTSQTIAEEWPAMEGYQQPAGRTAVATRDVRGRRLPDDVLALTSINLTESSLRYIDDTFGSLDHLNDLVNDLPDDLVNDLGAVASLQSEEGNCNSQTNVSKTVAPRVSFSSESSREETLDSGFSDKNESNQSIRPTVVTAELHEENAFRFLSPPEECNETKHRRKSRSRKAKQPIRNHDTSLVPGVTNKNNAKVSDGIPDSLDSQQPMATEYFMEPFPSHDSLNSEQLSNQNAKCEPSPSSPLHSDVTVPHHLAVPRSRNTSSSVETAV